MAGGLVGDLVRGGEVVAEGVVATPYTSNSEPRITLFVPSGAVELGLTYLFRPDGPTIALRVDQTPTSLKNVEGDLVDARIVCKFPA